MLANIVTQMDGETMLHNPLYLNDNYCMLGDVEEGYHLICARNSTRMFNNAIVCHFI